MATGSFGLCAWALAAGGSTTAAQPVALTTLVMFTGFHVFNARSVLGRTRCPNPLLLARCDRG